MLAGRTTPPLTNRELEEQRLRREANGTVAPGRPGIFDKARKKLIEEQVRKGLEDYDAKQNSNGGQPLQSGL